MTLQGVAFCIILIGIGLIAICLTGLKLIIRRKPGKKPFSRPTG
jgi:hypothetical protein